MASSSSLPSFCGVVRLSPARKVLQRRVYAQSFREEDNHRDHVSYEASEGLRGKKQRRSIVDENMDVLREKMEMVRMQERLRRPQEHMKGWYDYPLERNSRKVRGGDSREGWPVSLEVAELLIGSFGLPIIVGTLCLCVVSLLLRLSG